MLSQATSFWKLSALSTCCVVKDRTLYSLYFAVCDQWYDEGGVIRRLVDGIFLPKATKLPQSTGQLLTRS